MALTDKRKLIHPTMKSYVSLSVALKSPAAITNLIASPQRREEQWRIMTFQGQKIHRCRFWNQTRTGQLSGHGRTICKGIFYIPRPKLSVSSPGDSQFTALKI